ncbi:MAG: hypothetical protein AAF716_09105 [Cyanobacteria bacterium P01_D01_bin.1]
MTQPNPAQWLAEVQALQRQIGELQQERERAYESANNWRKLYDQEAQQRRRDSAIATGKIERLQKDISDLREAAREADTDGGPTDGSPTVQSLTQSDAQILELTQLKASLETAEQECKQLQTQIETERVAHAQTRNSLTAALGDAVDLLSKERAAANLEK